MILVGFTFILPSFYPHFCWTPPHFFANTRRTLCAIRAWLAVLRNGAGVPLDADGAERRVGGTDQNGWFIGENPIYKWMITRGTGYPLF